MSQSQYANLGLREAVVQCFGVGGARITERTRRHITRVVDIRCCLNADVVVIQLGENDYQRLSANTAVTLIYQLALELVERHNIRYCNNTLLFIYRSSIHIFRHA